MINIDTFIQKINETFKERLLSVMVYGGKALNDRENLKEDVDLIIIVENLVGEDLRIVSPIVKQFAKGKNPVPVFFDKEEWFSSADVYAMEYADIKQFHNVLYGQDLISDINIERTHLRFQCESGLKDLLVRFRRQYVRYKSDSSSLYFAMKDCQKDCRQIFKAILRLNNIEVPTEKEQVSEKISELNITNIEVFKEIADLKYKPFITKNSFLCAQADRVVDALSEILKYVDKL